MNWLAIGRLALSLLDKLAGYFRNKQLMDAGRAMERDRLSAEERERRNAANRAAVRSGTAVDADGVPNSFYRD